MSVTILKEITAVEEQAEQIEIQAVQKGREAVASAKADAAKMIAEAIEQAEDEVKKIAKANEETAYQDISRVRSQIRAQCDDIRKNTNERLDDAVDFIIGRIVQL